MDEAKTAVSIDDFEAIAQKRITEMLGKLVVENVSLRAQLEVLMKHVRENGNTIE